MSGSIRIVMVDTSHPGNIGASARAMKNMCLEELVLVRPRQFPHPEALARASGADDLLARARVSGSCAEALAGCGFVVATTSRARDQNFRVLEAREAARRLVSESVRGDVAVLFGAERSGLSNEELEQAHALLRIPTGETYASLNVAMAVQIVAYELLCARREAGQWQPPVEPPRQRDVPLAAPEALARLYEHWASVMDEVGFQDRTESGTHLLQRLRRLIQRAEPDANEVNILRGFLTAVQQRRRRAGQAHIGAGPAER